MERIFANQVFTSGVAVGKVFIVNEEELIPAEFQVTTVEEKEVEKNRFKNAVKNVSDRLKELATDNPIFAAHIDLVNDFMLHQSVENKIDTENHNAEKASVLAIGELENIFKSMDDKYMQERAADMVDIGKQLLSSLQNKSIDKFGGMIEPSIIIAKDLLPSDTTHLDKSKVIGFITEEGGTTSHVAIMAKCLAIPALVGVAGILGKVKEGDTVAFDAANGEILINPDSEKLENYSKKKAEQDETRAVYLKEAKDDVITKDGRHIKVYANVGSIEDIENAVSLDCDGVGLFRTEFLYMENSHFPTEEEQFEIYKEAVTKAKGELIIRTLDIGGDKSLPYYEFPYEENPFLGCRAIRFCLKNPDLLRVQFKAILRAGIYGKIRIMLPMIVSLDEANDAKKVYEEAKNELEKEGIEYANDLPFGMMIETPASVLLAEDFAKEMDFFSIGTNDLTQYILATDRGNKEIACLSTPFNPAVLRSIARVIDAAHKEGIEVGMCGEFASNEKSTLLLLGLGLDEFSMAASETPRIKYFLRRADYEKARTRAKEIISYNSVKKITKALDEWYDEVVIK